MLYPWQATQWQHILQQYNQERLPHALLLNGNAGLGKIDFAREVAKRLLCDNANGDDQACGQCRGCTLIQAGSHPDLFEITLQEKAKQIKVDQVRTLINKLNETAQYDGYQVAIVHPAETMNAASSNALLKTLEEPAGKVLFLLVSDQLGTIPATILSRCQTVHFAAKADAETKAWLAQQIPDADNSEQLLRLADNAPLRAIELAEINYLQFRDDILRHLIGIKKKSADPVSPVTDWLKQQPPELILSIMQSLLLDALRVQLGAAEDRLHHLDRAQPIQQLAASWSKADLTQLLQQVQNAQHRIVRGLNPNVQLMLEGLLIAV